MCLCFTARPQYIHESHIACARVSHSAQNLEKSRTAGDNWGRPARLQTCHTRISHVTDEWVISQIDPPRHQKALHYYMYTFPYIYLCIDVPINNTYAQEYFCSYKYAHIHRTSTYIQMSLSSKHHLRRPCHDHPHGTLLPFHLGWHHGSRRCRHVPPG